MTSRLASTANRALMKPLGAALAAGLVAASLAMPAQAEQRIVRVAADQAKVVPINGDPDTIILGNPTFADVSVQSGRLIVYGRSYGNTNLIVLNKNGAELENLVLQVYEGGQDKVSVYKAGKRSTLSCAPSCEVTLDIGDDAGAAGAAKSSIDNKLGLAEKSAK